LDWGNLEKNWGVVMSLTRGELAAAETRKTVWKGDVTNRKKRIKMKRNSREAPEEIKEGECEGDSGNREMQGMDSHNKDAKRDWKYDPNPQQNF